MQHSRWTTRLVAAASLVTGALYMSTAQAEPKVRLETSAGTVVLELDSERAPGTVKNFVQYVEEREAMWCGDTSSAPSWWTPPEDLGSPRPVEEIATLENSWLVGHYARDWLWEAQVSL